MYSVTKKMQNQERGVHAPFFVLQFLCHWVYFNFIVLDINDDNHGYHLFTATDKIENNKKHINIQLSVFLCKY